VAYAAAKLLQQTAQNSLLYGLFIIVVREQESALSTSLFVIAITAPSVLLSIPGGVIADALPRKLSLILSLAARAAIAWAFVLGEPSITMAVGLTLAVSSVQQVFGPADSGAFAAIVPDHHLGRASAIIHALTLLSQMLGAGLIAPVLIHVADDDALFVVVFSLIIASLIIYLLIPGVSPRGSRRSGAQGLVASLAEGSRIIRSHPVLLQITTLAILLDAALVGALVVVPFYVRDVLGVAAESAVYVFAPAAVGVAVGLVLAPALLAVLPPRPVVVFGFILTVGVLLTLPFIEDVSRYLDERTFLPLTWVEDWLNVRVTIAATALILPFGGLGMSLVEVGTRTALYRAAPANAVGHVLSTRAAAGALAALVPTLTVGLLLDVVRVETVILGLGAVTLALAVLVMFAPRRRPRSAMGQAAA